MQIYTKILIGMAAGAFIGLILGPNSAFLAQDTYRVPDASQLDLFIDAEEPQTTISYPQWMFGCVFLISTNKPSRTAWE
ncbi:MAG: hypothetical protein R3C68_14990 [Myxococcota bacterium]